MVLYVSKQLSIKQDLGQGTQCTVECHNDSDHMQALI